jgi:hypothetical protein
MVGKHDGNRALGRPRCGSEDNIIMVWIVLIWLRTGITDSFEHDSELFGCVKGGEFTSS